MSDTFHAFVGTYTDGESEGIYTCSLDAATGTLTREGVTDAGPNPSFLAVHPGGEYLYAVNEVDEGAVTALSIDRATGDLTVLNRVETGGGADPCHCVVDATGEYLLVAHYTGGSVAVVPVRDDGRVGEPTQVVDHEGSGPNPDRQASAHPHSIRPDPQNRFAYVPDLGTDRLYVYEMDLDAGRLDPADQHWLDLPGGAGPRHLAFHPDVDRLSLLNELDSTLVAVDRDPETGALDLVDSASTVPDGYDGENITADVHVHDSGRWVYASNRGHDSVAVFETDPATGDLDLVERVSTRGEWPRNFAITPPGSHLLVENQETNDVVTFAIGETDGALATTGDVAEIPQPVCLQFLATL